MNAVDTLRDTLPDYARDAKLNLQNVLGPDGPLTPAQRWGLAITSAAAARSPRLVAALVADARAAGVPDATLDDARAAATLMASNNVFYRFRHFIEAAGRGYQTRHPRLRMNRIAQPAATRIDLELFSLAASAINGCEVCVQAHEKSVIDGGLTEEHVHEAVRIAATLHAAAVALELVQT